MIIISIKGKVESKNTLKIALALIGVFSVGLVLCSILFYFKICKNRRQTMAPRHNKKLSESRLEQPMLAFPSLPSAGGGSNSYSHEFRATAAGDSTLKVL